MKLLSEENKEGNITMKEEIENTVPVVPSNDSLTDNGVDRDVCNAVCLETEHSAVVAALIGNGGDVEAAVVELFCLETNDDSIAPESPVDEHLQCFGVCLENQYDPPKVCSNDGVFVLYESNDDSIPPESPVDEHLQCFGACLENQYESPKVCSNDDVFVLCPDYLIDKGDVGYVYDNDVCLETEHSVVVEALIRNGGDVSAAVVELFHLGIDDQCAALESENAQGTGIIETDTFCFDPSLEEEYPTIYEALAGCAGEVSDEAQAGYEMIHKWE